MPAGPGEFPELGSPRWRLAPCSADWPQWMEDGACLEDADPGDPGEEEDPDSAPPPGLDDAGLAALIAGAREVAGDQARAAAVAARLGTTGALAASGAAALARRGPGMPGSARSFPGEYASRAAGFASGKPLDAAPGCAALGLFAEDAAGEDGRYAGAADDEVLGLICAWDRIEAHASARKHAMVAELIRRRPARGCAAQGPAGTPGQQELIVTIEPILTGECDHRHEARGHDPGVMLRHLAQIRNTTCTGPMCRRPASRSDFEHDTPYEAGGRTCLCNGNPKCRHDHRMKQDPRWQAEQLPGGDVRWTTPSGRQHTTEPTRHPI